MSGEALHFHTDNAGKVDESCSFQPASPPASPGLDNLLGNFLMLLIVSAAEWLLEHRGEYWRGSEVGDK